MLALHWGAYLNGGKGELKVELLPTFRRNRSGVTLIKLCTSIGYVLVCVMFSLLTLERK
jgi:hypothetical protein